MGATLDASYRHLGALHRAHDPIGHTAAHRLPRVTRHHAHALAGLAAHASGLDATARVCLADALEAALAAGRSPDLVLHAVVHTHRAYGLDGAPWQAHLRGPAPAAGAAGLPQRLERARHLATLLTPILEPSDVRYAAHLGDLAAAAALTAHLGTPEPGVPPQGSVDQALAGRARRLLVASDLGLHWLPPSSAAAVRTHRLLLAAALARLETGAGTERLRWRGVSPARRVSTRWANRAHGW